MAQKAISIQESYNLQQSLLKINKLEKEKAAAYLKINSLKKMTSIIALEAEKNKNNTLESKKDNNKNVIINPYVTLRPIGFHEPYSLFSLSILSAANENNHQFEIKQLNKQKLRVNNLKNEREEEVKKLQQRIIKINKEKESEKQTRQAVKVKKEKELARISEEKKQIKIDQTKKDEDSKEQAINNFETQQLAEKNIDDKELSDINKDMIPLYDIMIEHYIDKDPKMLSPAVLKDMLKKLTRTTNAIAKSKNNIALYKSFKYIDGEDVDDVYIYFSSEVSHNAELYEFYKPYADLLEEALIRGSYRELDVHLLPSSN
jgi:hypothetical protein